MQRSARQVKIFLSLLLLTLLVFGSVPAAQAQDQVTDPIKTYMPLVYKPEPPAWLGPDGGSVICLATDPANENIIYAGTLNAGIFKTTNKGASWSAVNSGLGDLFIDSLTIDPSNGNTLYAGTHSMGVYKSTNAGQSWSPANNGIAARSVVYTLTVHPTNSNIVFAGTRIQGTYYVGILYKSVNGGASWENVMYFSDDWVYSVAISPTNPNIVMAAVHTRGPYISTSSGNKNTWQQGLPPTGYDDYLIERWKKGRAVAFDPRPENRAYYTAWHDGLISYSLNNGFNWIASGGTLGGAQIYPNGISIKPSNPNTVYLVDHDRGTVNGVTTPGYVMKSTDSGRTYQPTNLRRILYSVAALRGSGDTVLAGTYLDGLHKSNDGGASWSYSMTGIVNSYVTGMVFPGNNTVYASTKSGGGVFRSTNGGLNWTLFNAGLNDTKINGLVMHPTNPNILFALTNSAGLRRLDLSVSQNWSSAVLVSMASAMPVQETFALDISDAAEDLGEMIDPGDEALFGVEMNTLAVSAPVLSLAFAPSNANIAYLGTNGGGVYWSINGGLSWNYAGFGQGVVRSIAVSPNNPSLVYAATNEKGLARVSSDGGKNWATSKVPDSTVELYSVAILPDRPNEVYFGTSNGVFRYNGSSWEHIGLGGYKVYSLGYHAAAPSRLIAGTQAGAFLSQYGWNNWSVLANELSDKVIASLSFDPQKTRYVYAGTEYRGTLRVAVEQ